jgi:hypothetical protein
LEEVENRLAQRKAPPGPVSNGKEEKEKGKEKDKGKGKKKGEKDEVAPKGEAKGRKGSALKKLTLLMKKK